MAAEPLLQYSPCSLDPCHWLPDTGALTWKPSQGIKLYCLVTEAHWCEQLAQGCCPTMQRPEVEPATSRSWVRHANHYTTKPTSVLLNVVNRLLQLLLRRNRGIVWNSRAACWQRLFETGKFRRFACSQYVFNVFARWHHRVWFNRWGTLASIGTNSARRPELSHFESRDGSNTLEPSNFLAINRNIFCGDTCLDVRVECRMCHEHCQCSFRPHHLAKTSFMYRCFFLT